MKKTLVAFYSRTGSNRYLAKRLAHELDADLESIRPRGNFIVLLILFSLIRWSFGIRRFQHRVEDYDRLVIVGPIWTGQLISPLRDTIRKYRNAVPDLYLAVCCGSTDAMKDERFGYEHVFTLARGVARDTPISCAAFPVALVIQDEEPTDEQIMETRLSDDNFQGVIRNRMEAFVNEIQGAQVGEPVG